MAITTAKKATELINEINNLSEFGELTDNNWYINWIKNNVEAKDYQPLTEDMVKGYSKSDHTKEEVNEYRKAILGKWGNIWFKIKRFLKIKLSCNTN
jgi:uncharacterized coiled-coil DUF342 family protein